MVFSGASALATDGGENSDLSDLGLEQVVVPAENLAPLPSSAVPIEAAAAEPVLEDSEDDVRAFEVGTGKLIWDVSTATPALGSGYEILDGIQSRAYSYTVKLVDTPGVEQFRPILQDIANELRAAGMADLTIAPGRFQPVSTNNIGLFDIYFDTFRTTECPYSSTKLSGCAYLGMANRATTSLNNYVVVAGKVTLYPWTEGASLEEKRHVVAHEIGHVLGLAHTISHVDGARQLMHPTSYDANRFQPGDLAGLATTGRDFKPYGALEIAGIPIAGQIRLAGWTFDPDSPAPAKVRVTVDGVIVVEQITNKLRADVNTTYSLPAVQQRGFDITVKAANANHVVCVSTLNYPRTDYQQIGCKSVIPLKTIVTDRLSGTDRYDSAVVVSKAAFPTTAKVVFIATGADFPDALAAGPAASYLGGPLLLTPVSALPTTTKAEIARLKPQTIVIVGGTASVSLAVETQLKTMAAKVVRINGTNRYDTSRKVIDYAFTGTYTMYVASGNSYPDALSVGAAAAAAGQPLLLVDGTQTAMDDTFRRDLSDFLIHHGVHKFVVVGGESSVSPGLFDALHKMVTNTSRISGPDRYQTAVAVSMDSYPSAARAFIVTGMNFPEGLVVPPLSAQTKSPVFLSSGTCVQQSVISEMNMLGVSRLTLIGGIGSLDTNVASLKPC